MRKTITAAAAIVICIAGTTAGTKELTKHAFINFDESGNMILSGPFNLIVPMPEVEGARKGGPEHSILRIPGEYLKTSRAGYFVDDRFVAVQVETTNAPRGTLTNENLPIMEVAGRDFRVRTLCIDISQEELDADDDSIFEFIEDRNVQIVPAVNVMQLFANNDDGTAEGIVMYVRNVSGGCESLTAEFEAEFKAAFERFIQSIIDAN
jgi:hypothetical protein